MNKEKLRLVGYWLVTAALAANYAFAGVMYVQLNPQVIEGAKMLGYPLYFFQMLGVGKLLGAIVIVIPKTPLFKEWAYAGILINLIAASYSNYSSHAETWHVIMPLVMLLIAAVSWSLRPASRRFSGPLK